MDISQRVDEQVDQLLSPKALRPTKGRHVTADERIAALEHDVERLAETLQMISREIFKWRSV